MAAFVLARVIAADPLPRLEETPPGKRKFGQVYLDEGGRKVYWPKPLVSADDVYGSKLHIRPMPRRGYTDKDYVTEGFDVARLGKLPPRGQHPRLYIVPDDLARIRENVARGEKAPLMFRVHWHLLMSQGGIGDDGKVKKVAEFGRVGYDMTNNFHRQALYAQITNDDELGRKLAARLAEAAREDHKVLDLFDTRPERDNVWVVTDTRWMEDGHKWKGRGQWYWVAYPEAYDLAWRWLTEEERAVVRGVMARLQADRYTHFMELPANKHLINHASMGMWWVACPLAIEGEEGWNEANYRFAREKLDEVLDWYISPAGEMYENVKGFLPWPVFLAIARRENGRILQHPHVAAHMHRIFMSAKNVNHAHASWTRPPVRGKSPRAKKFWDVRNPDSRVWNVRVSGHPGSLIATMTWLYPRRPDFDFVYKAFNMQMNYPFTLDKEVRTWNRPVEFPAIQLAFATDGLTGEDRKPIDWNSREVDFTDQLSLFDPERGISQMRSSWDRDALQLRLECRSDFYTGGHESPEYGNFLFASDGVLWAPYQRAYQPVVHRNMVSVDGKAGGYPPVAGRFVSLDDAGVAAAAVCDYREALQYTQHSRQELILHPKLNVPFHHWMRGGYGWHFSRDYQASFQPQMRWFHEYFSSCDFGHWDGQNTMNSWFKRILPPAEKAWRTLQMARGDHPYLLVIDDIKLDEQKHAFRWNLNLNNDVTLIDQRGENDLIFGRLDIDGGRNNGWRYQPKKGEPLLLVRVLNRNTDDEHPHSNFENADGWPCAVIPAHTTSPDYRVLVYPYRHQVDPTPITEWSEDRSRLTVILGDTRDEYVFAEGQGGRTLFTMARDGKLVQTVGGRPDVPVFQGLPPVHPPSRYPRKGPELGPPPQQLDPPPTPRLVFVDEATVRFASPGPGQEIRYTLGGSDPTPASTLYTGPFQLTKTVTVKARSFNRRWLFGPESGSAVRQAEFVKAAPAPAQAAPADGNGLLCRVYEIFTVNWDETGHYNPELNLLPDLDRYKPILTVATPGFELPPVTPQKPIEWNYKGFYRFNGAIDVPETAAHTFSVHSCGPVRLTVAGRTIIEETGQYHQNLIDRHGRIALAKGLHAVELIVTDPVFWKIGREGPMPFEVRAGGEPLPDAWCRADAEQLRRHADNPFAPTAESLPVLAAVKAPAARLKHGLVRSTFNRVAMVPPSDGWLFSNKAGPKGLLDVQDETPLETVLVDGLIEGSDYDGQLYEYSGFYRAPYDGVYEFQLDAQGNNQLRIDGTIVVQNNVPMTRGDRPDGRVRLQAGLHALSLRFGRSAGLVRVKTPADASPQPLGFADLFRPADARALADPNRFLVWDFPLTALAKPEGTAKGPLGAFTYEVRGGKVVKDERFGHVLELAGDVTGILLRDYPCVQRGATIAFWARTEGKNARHGLLNLSGEGAQSYIHGNHIRCGYSRFYGSDAGYRGADISPGAWFHCAVTFGDSVRVYINGKLVADRFQKGNPTWQSRPHNLNARTDQISLFCGRGAGGPCFQGKLAGIRLYSAVLDGDDVAKLFKAGEGTGSQTP
jgi:hypothetical protein